MTDIIAMIWGFIILTLALGLVLRGSLWALGFG
jgi:hypothetical protein